MGSEQSAGVRRAWSASEVSGERRGRRAKKGRIARREKIKFHARVGENSFLTIFAPLPSAFYSQ